MKWKCSTTPVTQMYFKIMIWGFFMMGFSRITDEIWEFSHTFGIGKLHNFHIFRQNRVDYSSLWVGLRFAVLRTRWGPPWFKSYPSFAYNFINCQGAMGVHCWSNIGGGQCSSLTILSAEDKVNLGIYKSTKEVLLPRPWSLSLASLKNIYISIYP